jgi:hypothetical protein
MTKVTAVAISDTLTSDIALRAARMTSEVNVSDIRLGLE